MLFVLLLKKGIDFNSILNHKRKSKTKTPFKKVYRNKTKIATYSKDENQKKIDDILDKISKSGYDNLSKQEKEYLFKQGK